MNEDDNGSKELEFFRLHPFISFIWFTDIVVLFWSCIRQSQRDISDQGTVLESWDLQ